MMSKQNAWMLFLNSVHLLSPIELIVAKKAFLFAWDVANKKDHDIALSTIFPEDEIQN